MHANTPCPPRPPRSRLRPAPAVSLAVPPSEPVRVGRVPAQASWRVPRAALGDTTQAARATLQLPGAGHGGGSGAPTPMAPPPHRQAPLRPSSPVAQASSPPRTPRPAAAQPDDSLWDSPPETAQSLSYAAQRMWPASPGPAARFLSAWTYATNAEDRSGPAAGTPQRLGPLRSPGMSDAPAVYRTAPQNSPVAGTQPPLDSPAWEPGSSSPTPGGWPNAAGDHPVAASVYHTPQARVSEGDDGEARDAETGSDASDGGSSTSSFGCATARRIERARR